MKTTEQHLTSVLADVIESKKREAKTKGIPFVGVPSKVLYDEMDKRLGTADWMAVEDEVIRITKDDVNAMANGRFFRKAGLRMLMLWAIVVLGLATLNTRLNIFANTVYADAIYYVLESVATVVFMTFFAKGQRQVRRELRERFEAGGFNLGKD